MYIPGEVIGIIALVAIFFICVLRYNNKDNYTRDWNHIINQSDYSYEYEQFRNNNRNYSEKQAIKHFIANKGEQNILDSYNKRLNYKKELKDEYNKELIKERVFSYQYEDLIFSMFSKFAKKEYGSWRLPLSTYLSEEYVLSHIKSYYNIGDNEANDILNILVNNKLLDNHLYKDKYEMGHVLACNPNIISESDMNFNKWVNSHTSTL